MVLFIAKVHGCEPLINIFTKNSVLDIAAVLDYSLYFDIPNNSLISSKNFNNLQYLLKKMDVLKNEWEKNIHIHTQFNQSIYFEKCVFF